ncbi:MAG TPA: hypothetical protein VLT33_32635 [Labilithrix sp.]|nr:hypothetical protein [Labilithrix sp.]
MKPWLRPLPFALLAGYALSRVGRTPVDDAAPSRSAALCGALPALGVTCVPEDVTWVDAPRGVLGATVGHARAIVRGHEKERAGADPAGASAPSEKNDTFDLFMVSARLSPEGHLLDVGDLHDLTRTSGADEGVPVLRGNLAAYVVALDGRPEAVHVLDFDGPGRSAYEELSRFQRFQIGVADWQRTGQSRGVRRTVYALVPAPTRADLAFLPDGTLEIKTEARSLIVDPARETIASGTEYLRVTTESVTKPPTFGPWMSDRLRAVSWFGDEKNQILKVVTFTALEWLKGVRAKITGDTGEKDAQEDLAALNHESGGSPPATFADPEIGWPPRALEPMIKPPLNGEGQWIPLEKDAFITPIPGVPAPFLTTFVRGDPAAPQTRVYVTLWDPRLIALHMEAGTVEPVSATGEAGPGQIPRTPEVIRHVVAGFNGGFQATHGEFGMQANGVLYLPPKPYGATVMELRDGTTAFGAWPKATEVPDEVLSFRQNMTALVQNDKFNPWGRAWWGGVPPGWHDAIHTTRSGVCLTKENFVAYFWGNDIGPEPLGRAMLMARCAFGIHLDMNPGLAGFEFYNVQTTSNFQPLGRPLQPDWEYEGGFKDLPDFKFRARRMVKSMGHMLFPRYIHRDARDFFYLTARTVLPGAPIAAAGEPGSPMDGEGGNWRVKGLPQHGYPYALAITSVRLGPGATDKRARVLRVDPRTVMGSTSTSTPSAEGDGGVNAASAVVAAFGRPRVAAAAAGDKKNKKPAATAVTDGDAGVARRLWIGGHVFGIDKGVPAAGVAIADVVALDGAGASESRSAVGIADEDGMLQWVELLPEDKADAATADQMLKLLERLGCSSRGLVTGEVRAFLGGSLDIGGQPAPAPALTVRLLRTAAPGARPMFESTEIVPQSVWFPLQEKRVKWRPTLAPPDKPAASGAASGAPPAPPAPK